MASYYTKQVRSLPLHLRMALSQPPSSVGGEKEESKESKGRAITMAGQDEENRSTVSPDEEELKLLKDAPFQVYTRVPFIAFIATSLVASLESIALDCSF